MAYPIDRYLKFHSPTLVELDTPNTRRTFYFQMWIFWSPFILFIDFIGYISGMKVPSLLSEDAGYAILFYLLHLVPISCFILWLFTKPAYLFFDRASKEVISKSGDLEIRYPWRNIRFESGWIPTKRGGVHYLMVKAGPPFPEIILKKNARKLTKAGNKEFFVGLGGFDCRNGDEVRAYVRFFEGFMESDESLEEILKHTLGRKG